MSASLGKGFLIIFSNACLRSKYDPVWKPSAFYELPSSRRVSWLRKRSNFKALSSPNVYTKYFCRSTSSSLSSSTSVQASKERFVGYADVGMDGAFYTKKLFALVDDESTSTLPRFDSSNDTGVLPRDN